MSKKIIHLAVLPAILAAAAFAAGCQLPWEQSQRGGSMAVLIGKSPTTLSAPDVLTTNAKAAVERAAADGAHLLVGAIGAPASAAWTVDMDLRLTGAATSNTHAAAEQRAAHSRGAMRKLGALLAEPAPRRPNDTFAAAAAAARALQHLPAPKTLVVLDDLHIIGSCVNVYKQHLTSRRIRQILKCLRPLPDLHDVTLVFANVALDRRAEQTFSLKRERRIERLVRAWARACSAKDVSFDSMIHLPGTGAPAP